VAHRLLFSWAAPGPGASRGSTAGATPIISGGGTRGSSATSRRRAGSRCPRRSCAGDRPERPRARAGPATRTHGSPGASPSPWSGIRSSSTRYG